jgi:hypothetical protein
MKCVTCDFEISDGAKFCSECGIPVDSVATSALPAPAGGRAKTAVARTAKVVGSTATETVKVIGSTAKEGLRSDMGKSIATGAALGAVIAMPIPFVGSALGASVGAIIGAVRKF